MNVQMLLSINRQAIRAAELARLIALLPKSIDELALRIIAVYLIANCAAM
jgi:hypothetical protein